MGLPNMSLNNASKGKNFYEDYKNRQQASHNAFSNSF